MEQVGPSDPKDDTDSQFSAKITMSSKSRTEQDKILIDSNSDSDTDSEFECRVCDKRFSGYKPFLQHEKSLKHKKALEKKKNAKKLLEKIAVAENASGDDGDLLPITDAAAYAACKACNKEFGGPESYLAHLASKAHKKKARQASILDLAVEDGEINLDKLKKLLNKDLIENIKGNGHKDDLGESEAFECKDCDKSFSGLEPYVQHMTSKVHAKTVGKNKLMVNLVQKGVQQAGPSQNKDAVSLTLEDGILVCKLCTVTFSGPENAMLHLKSRGHKKNLDKFARKKHKRLAATDGEYSPPGSGSNVAKKEVDDPKEDQTSSAAESESDSDDDSESDSKESSDIAYHQLADDAASGERSREPPASRMNQNESSKPSAEKQGTDEADRKAASDHFLEYFLNMPKEDIAALEEFRDAVNEPGSDDTSDEESMEARENISSELYESSLLALLRKHEDLIRSSGASSSSSVSGIKESPGLSGENKPSQKGITDYDKISELYATYKEKLKESKEPEEET